MSFDTLGELNWLAVLGAAVAYFVLGGLWYSPAAFGKPWMRAAGIEPDVEGPGAAVYIAPLVGCIVAAIATGMLVVATGSDEVGDGIVLGLVTGIGFALTLIGTTAMFEPSKPNAALWGVITGGYHAVGFMIMAVVVSVWN